MENDDGTRAWRKWQQHSNKRLPTNQRCLHCVTSRLTEASNRTKVSTIHQTSLSRKDVESKSNRRMFDVNGVRIPLAVRKDNSWCGPRVKTIETLGAKAIVRTGELQFEECQVDVQPHVRHSTCSTSLVSPEAMKVWSAGYHHVENTIQPIQRSMWRSSRRSPLQESDPS